EDALHVAKDGARDGLRGDVAELAGRDSAGNRALQELDHALVANPDLALQRAARREQHPLHLLDHEEERVAVGLEKADELGEEGAEELAHRGVLLGLDVGRDDLLDAVEQVADEGVEDALLPALEVVVERTLAELGALGDLVE